MNFRKKSKPALPQFQMTAMMDVVFLLLCFFVTTSVFSQWECEVQLTLPTAKSAVAPERMPGEIILNVAKDGSVTVNQHKLSAEDLATRLKRVVSIYPGQPVVIRADKDTSYDSLMKVIDVCRESDVWSFSLATKDVEKK